MLAVLTTPMFILFELVEFYKIKVFLDDILWFPFVVPMIVIVFFRVTKIG